MAAAEDGMEGEEVAVSPITMARGYCKTLPHSTDSSQPFYGPLASRITHYHRNIFTSAVKRSIGSTTGCTITEKAPTRPFSWLKAPTSAFTFKTLLRHYAKQALTPRSLNVKLGPRLKSQKGRAG